MVDFSIARRRSSDHARAIVKPKSNELWLLLPAIILIGSVQILPAGVALFTSVRSVQYYIDSGWAGLDNYAKILANQDFWKAAGISVIFTVSSLALSMVIAFLLALVISRAGRVGTVIVSLLLIPWAMSPFVVSLLWNWILQPGGSGLLNGLLGLVGIAPISALSTPTSSLVAMIGVAVWRNVAFAALTLLAGLSQVPRDLGKAASVDGATALERFWKITFPLVRQSVVITVVVLCISYFNEVQIVIGLTSGGPAGATTTLSYYLYQLAFQTYNEGQSNAMAVLMFLINVLLIIVFTLLVGRQKKRTNQ